ncbi:MAG: metallophosphoesterase [Myxococcota bacterium]|nr:metallophosphoesterase [Myxococcota bacterium]
MVFGRQRTLLSWILWILVVTACAASHPVPTQAPAQVDRIVAIGDVHGSFDGLVDILRETSLIDETHRWIGGNTVLVQTGDLLDRGEDPFKVMDLVIDLQNQAPKSGGKVIVLLGNHEVMNLTRDVDDVSPTAMANAAPGQSPEEGEKAYIDALGPNGKYGKWLRTLGVIAKVEDTIFVHGGISPEMSTKKLDQINQAVQEELARFDQYWDVLVSREFIAPGSNIDTLPINLNDPTVRERATAVDIQRAHEAQLGLSELMSQGMLFREDGPLWFRGLADWPESDLKGYIPEFLKKHGARRIVVGHTVRRGGRIEKRLDGRVFAIDTGMLSNFYKGGQPSALEINRSRITAIYKDEKQPLVVMPPPSGQARQMPVNSATIGTWIGPKGAPLPFADNQQVLTFLRTATVVKKEEIPVGITRPVKIHLKQQGVRAHAVFRTLHEKDDPHYSGGFISRGTYFRDSYLNEAAAYALSQLLGMGNIPPTVLRTIGGEEGSLQLWVEQTMTNRQRLAQHKKPPDMNQWNCQLWDMRVFDNLINNTDRNQGNMLIDTKWRVWLIDHSRSFAQDKELPTPEKIKKCSRDLWQALLNLDETAVRARLKPYLSNREVRALLYRRERVIDKVQDLIADRGETAVLFDP